MSSYAKNQHTLNPKMITVSSIPLTFQQMWLSVTDE